MSINTPDSQVNIIAVTDGYTNFLSVPVSISLQYPFVVLSGWRAVTFIEVYAIPSQFFVTSLTWTWQQSALYWLSY